ncbi:MAG: hypothetical protein ACKV2T_06620 [Kofleriaceae bacterium]
MLCPLTRSRHGIEWTHDVVTRAENDSTFRPLDSGGAIVGSSVTLLGTYPNYAKVAMAFDGANYLVVLPVYVSRSSAFSSVLGVNYILATDDNYISPSCSDRCC